MLDSDTSTMCLTGIRLSRRSWMVLSLHSKRRLIRSCYGQTGLLSVALLAEDWMTLHTLSEHGLQASIGESMVVTLPRAWMDFWMNGMPRNLADSLLISSRLLGICSAVGLRNSTLPNLAERWKRES